MSLFGWFGMKIDLTDVLSYSLLWLFGVLFYDCEYLIECALCPNGVVVLHNDQFLKDCTISGADEVGVLAIDHCIFLAVNEQSWHFALSYILQLDFKGIVSKLCAVLSCQIKGDRNYKLRCLHVFASDFEGYHLKGVKGRVDYLQ